MVILLGCTKPKDNIFVVKVGNHYCNNRRLMIVKDKQIHLSFQVNDSWNWEYGMELSKVSGLSFGDPKKNSIRLAVRSTENGSQMYAFAHVDGKITIRELATIGNGWHDCSVSYETDRFVVVMDEWRAVIHAKKGLKMAELCYPYIGGDYTIDHDWEVPIEFE